jgi:hypothetical protein
LNTERPQPAAPTSSTAIVHNSSVRRVEFTECSFSFAIRGKNMFASRLRFKRLPASVCRSADSSFVFHLRFHLRFHLCFHLRFHLRFKTLLQMLE